MLVLEPSKRFSIEQIKKHHWMQMDGGAPSKTPSSPVMGCKAKLGEYNDQILRLMQSLGINQQNTVEVRFLPNKSIDKAILNGVLCCFIYAFPGFYQH